MHYSPSAGTLRRADTAHLLYYYFTILYYITIYFTETKRGLSVAQSISESILS